MKRVLLAVLGSLAMLLGLASILAGAWICLVFNTADRASTAMGTITTRTDAHAVVIDVAGVGVASPVGPIGGSTNLTFTATDSKPLAVGVGQRSLIDTYLSGSRYDVGRATGRTWTVTPVPGTQPLAPLPPWIHTGTVITLPVSAGTTIVLANQDRSAPVSARLTLQLHAAGARVAGYVALGLGFLVVAVGLLLLVSGVRRRTVPGSVQDHTTPASALLGIPSAATTDSSTNPAEADAVLPESSTAFSAQTPASPVTAPAPVATDPAASSRESNQPSAESPQQVTFADLPKVETFTAAAAAALAAAASADPVSASETAVLENQQTFDPIRQTDTVELPVHVATEHTSAEPGQGPPDTSEG